MSVLEPFEPFIADRLTEHPELTCTRLLWELRGRGYRASVCMVRRRNVRAPRQRKAYLRVETEPGEVGQIDWGFFGQLRSPVSPSPRQGGPGPRD